MSFYRPYSWIFSFLCIGLNATNHAESQDVEASKVEQTWLAGASSVKITPESPMPMAGYASRGSNHSSGTLTDLWAKALILEDAHGRRGLLITMDLCGIDRRTAQQIQRVLAERIGVRRSEIILSVSHTHSGPVVGHYLAPMHLYSLPPSDQQLIGEYTDYLTERVVLCAQQAIENQRPSRLAFASGKTTFAVNRRNNPADSVEVWRGAGKLLGPVDHSVPVLAVYQEDRLAATVFGYACHCTTLSDMQWSADYAGFAQADLEQEQPGCIAMFWAGCGADQNPLPRREVKYAKAYGSQLANAVKQTLDGVVETIPPALVTRYREIHLPLADLPTPEQLRADQKSSDRYTAARASYLLQKIENGESRSPTYPYPVASWSLGGKLDWVVLGGEVVVDYALAIKAMQADNKAVWIMAYANDVMAYIPSRRVLAEGGYEGGGAMVYYGLPSAWSPEVEKMILDEVVRQLRPSQSEGTRVFSPDATPQIHQDVGAGEGPLWSDELGLLTSGDGHIMRRTLDGQLLVHLKDAGSNGLAFDAEGRLLICQFKARQVSRLEKDGSLTILTDRFEGAQYNQPNDLTVDTQGRIYFSDPQYGPRDQMEMRDGEGRLVEGVYRIDLDGQVSRIISHEVDRPNGLAISADDRYLFVADNNNNTLRGARKLWRFELTPAGDIAPGSRELLFDWRQTRGPDGLELDEMGRIYVAAGINRDNAPYETQAHPTAGVYVFSPEGELLDFRAIPRDECTNVAFGGIDRKTLYVTAGGSLWSIPTLVPGKSIVQQ